MAIKESLVGLLFEKLKNASIPLVGTKINKGVFYAKYTRDLTGAEKSVADTLLADFNTGKYDYTINRVYPNMGNQLDMLWHDIDSGKFGEAAKTSSFYLNIKTVKTAYPK